MLKLTPLLCVEQNPCHGTIYWERWTLIPTILTVYCFIFYCRQPHGASRRYRCHVRRSCPSSSASPASNSSTASGGGARTVAGLPEAAAPTSSPGVRGPGDGQSVDLEAFEPPPTYAQCVHNPAYMPEDAFKPPRLPGAHQFPLNPPVPLGNHHPHHRLPTTGYWAGNSKS